MKKEMKILGIIPARGGSKSIPRKNIKPFLGRPLISWTTETALESGILDRLIVSTDDEEIADIAKKANAEVPFLRPKELAEDHTPTLPVLQHALTWLKEKEGYWPDAVMLLEATNPLRRPFHLREIAELFKKSLADSVVSVTEAPAQYNPHWMFREQKDGYAALFTGEALSDYIPRRQLLPKAYVKGTAIYMFKPENIFAARPSAYGEKIKLYVVDSKYGIDIDELRDWPKAEEALKQILKEESAKK